MPTLERFRVIRALGAGAMGTVFEAEDRLCGSRIALKLLSSYTPDSIVRFKTEFRALRDLHHPNLVRLGELFEVEGSWFFTMEIVDGVDFLAFVRPCLGDEGGSDTRPHDMRPAGFDEPRLRSALGQLAEGLLALHGAGKLHRDVKPSNIRIDRNGRVVLLDFGLVTNVDTRHDSMERSIVGTATYMAPEQGAALPLGPAADWYAVGVMLYEALTGTLPFEGHAIEVLVQKQQHEPPLPEALIPGVPDDLNHLCVRLLRRDPAERADGADVLRTLGRNAPRPVVERDSHATISTVFVGRVAELGQLSQALEDAVRGEAVAVVVEGESGVGKSALIRQFCSSLQETHPGVLVLSGRCYEWESVPYKGLDMVMEALARHLYRMDQVDAALLLPRDAALLVRVFPALHRVPAVRRATAMDDDLAETDLRARAFSAFRELLWRIAHHSPVIILIDDFQWADVDSLALLSELLGGDDLPRMLLLLTLRTETEPTRASLPLLTMLRKARRVRHVQLTGLAPDESSELATLLCEQFDVREADAHAIAREAGGHPFLLAELVRYAAASGTSRQAMRVEDALLYRIAQLETIPRRMLATVAVAGGPILAAIATAATGLSSQEATISLGVLRAAMFVRSAIGDAIECSHDRVREAVYATVSDAERRLIHARLAEAIEEAEPAQRDPHALVRHLLAAGEAERAARCAIEAAQQAAETFAFDRAASLFQVALSVGVLTDHERFDLTTRLAHALENAGRTSEAADAFLEASGKAATRAQHLELKRRASEQLLVGGYLDRGLQELRAVLHDAGLTVPRSRIGTLVSLLWHRFRLRVRGTRWTERDLSEIPAQLLQVLEIHRSIAIGFGAVDTIRAAVSNVKGLLLALAAGERRHIARYLSTEAAYRAAQGGTSAAEVEALIAKSKDIALKSDDRYLKGFAIAAAGCAHECLGLRRQALEELTEAGEVWQGVPGITWERNHVRLFRLQLLRDMGLLHQLCREFDEYSRDAASRGDRFAETTILRAANIVWLVRGDAARAAEDLDHTSWMKLDTGFVHLQHLFELGARVNIALYRGEGDRVWNDYDAQFRTIKHSLLMSVRALRCDFYWILARCALAEQAAHPSPKPRKVMQLVHKLRGQQLGYAAAWAELVRAAAWTQAGEREAAIASLHVAMELAEQNSLYLCKIVARRRLGELIGGTAGRELVEQANSSMMIQGVFSPEAIANVIAPGFRS